MYDFHMHSHFSSDCNFLMEEMILSAIQKGLKEITFTDHIDYDYNSPEIDFEFDTDVYLETIAGFKEKYSHQIKINVGIEIGIQPHILERCSLLVSKTKPDFIIASQHNVQRKDLYLGDYYVGKEPLEALAYAMKELEEMIDQFKDFSVIGHLDILKRYHQGVRELPKSEYLRLAQPVLEKLIQVGKGIEVNTSGLRQGLNETLPSYELLELYHRLGGRLLTIGADAHQPEDVGHSFPEVLQALKTIGFENIYSFEKMKPIPHSIETIIELYDHTPEK